MPSQLLDDKPWNLLPKSFTIKLSCLQVLEKLVLFFNKWETMLLSPTKELRFYSNQICLEMLSWLHRTNVPQGGHSLWIKAWEQWWLLLQGKLQRAIMERDKNLCSQRGDWQAASPPLHANTKAWLLQIVCLCKSKGNINSKSRAVGWWGGCWLAGFCSWVGYQTDKPYHIHCEPWKPLGQILLLGDVRVKVYVFKIGFGTVGPAATDLIQDPFLYFLNCFP